MCVFEKFALFYGLSALCFASLWPYIFCQSILRSSNWNSTSKTSNYIIVIQSFKTWISCFSKHYFYFMFCADLKLAKTKLSSTQSEIGGRDGNWKSLFHAKPAFLRIFREIWWAYRECSKWHLDKNKFLLEQHVRHPSLQVLLVWQ